MPVDLKRLTRELREIRERHPKGLRRVSREEVLENVKAFEARRTTIVFAPDAGPACSECDDLRVQFITDGKGVRRAKPCVCQAPRPTAAPGTIFECPMLLADASLDNFTVCLENTHALQAARECATGGRQHLYFNGRPGRGKSHLAVATARAHADQGKAAAFVSVPWLIALAQRGIDDPRKRAEAGELEDRALSDTIVVLDDVAGGEKGSDFTRGILTRILERRYSKQLCTIITSNFDLGRLAEYYDDERIVSRIAGACGETFEIGGPDRRLARPPASQHGHMRIVRESS